MGLANRVMRSGFVIGSLVFLLAAVAGATLLLGDRGSGGALEEGGLSVCPGPGRWAMSAWSGDDGAPAETALATCADIRAAYSLEPYSQLFLRNFGDERPDLNTLSSLDSLQGLLLLGGPDAEATAYAGGSLPAAQEGLFPCPPPGRWAISVWTGDDDTPVEDALATCTSITAAYWLDPDSQLFLRNFGGLAPGLNTLLAVDNLQALLVRGGVDPVLATLQSAKTTFSLDEPIELTFAIHNISGRPVTLVKPFISPNLVFFEVVDADGAALPFDGPWAKLKPFLSSQFVTIEMGESVEQVFDLAQLYDISDPGSYTVTADYMNWDDGRRFGFSAFTIDHVVSNELDIEITE